jgi:hypothetical protein
MYKKEKIANQKRETFIVSFKSKQRYAYNHHMGTALINARGRKKKATVLTFFFKSITHNSL